MEMGQQQQQQPQPSSHHLMKRVIDSKTPQECLTSVSSSPKPNQVSTVLLYGIPIVSLYIEGQERLCLAQISNTLLKQYSYNEIHNRRVALGITCVQCTPVQLEILRRAGAMPVSSRRCGMITRREAERLCKSFLGDNSPPRLPEDFAFSVHHECAWGCRGSFLPARYNSSRAKCIKCAYCGLFFSPNKFIFHSHRIGPADKYVQPDAANFNSWRRHMKLSGNPPEEIIHAWEDVKAMFNGGTRKRLIISTSSSRGGGVTASQNGRDISCNNNDLSSPKRLKEIPQSALKSSHELNSPVIHAAASVTVVSATSTTNRTATDNSQPHPIRPVQLLPNGHVTSSNANNVNSLAAPITSSTPIPSRIPSALCTDLPLHFTRGLMMDYMWHAQTKASAFQFSNYALPWIKRPNTLFLNHQASSAQQQQQQSPQPMVNGSPLASITTTTTTTTTLDDTYLSGDSPAPSISAASTPPPPAKLASLPFYNNSAFRPVINHHNQLTNHRSANIVSMPNLVKHHLDDDQRTSSSRNSRDGSGSGGSATIKDSLSSDEDDEMVDIETTEEDEGRHHMHHQNHHHHHHSHHQRYNDPYPSRVINTHSYRHIDDLIGVRMPKSTSSPPLALTTVNVETIAENINCWNDPTTADYLKKKLSCRNLTTSATLQSSAPITAGAFAPTPSPPPVVVSSHSSPESSSSCGLEGGGDVVGVESFIRTTNETPNINNSDLVLAKELPHQPTMMRLNNSNVTATATSPTLILDSINNVMPRAAAAAAAAAAAVAIAAFSQSNSQSPADVITTSAAAAATTKTAPATPLPIGSMSKSFYDNDNVCGEMSTTFSHNLFTCDKANLTNSIYNNFLNNNNNVNGSLNNNNGNMNSSSRSSNISNSSLTNTILNNNNNSNSNNNCKLKSSSNCGLISVDSPILSTSSPVVMPTDRLCNVARLPFDRIDYAMTAAASSLPPFYRQHDVQSNKHFQPFRHHHQVEQTATTTPTSSSGGTG